MAIFSIFLDRFPLIAKLFQRDLMDINYKGVLPNQASQIHRFLLGLDEADEGTLVGFNTREDKIRAIIKVARVIVVCELQK